MLEAYSRSNENNGRYQRPRDFSVWGVVGLCALTKSQFVKEVFSLPTTPVSATVDLVGVPMLVAAKEDASIAEMYNKSTLATIDGMPLVKKGRKEGFQCDRCSAPDIMGLVFAESVKRGKTHFFYGGANNSVLDKLRTNLEQQFPGIKIAGMYSPPFRPLTEQEDRNVCHRINDARPDFLWVGIGAPKQELWMQAHQDKINETVMLGVGAGFNFFAGTLAKAPRWMEKLGLEWLFRLCHEPKRLWRRYVIGGIKYVYYSIQTRLTGESK